MCFNKDYIKKMFIIFIIIYFIIISIITVVYITIKNDVIKETEHTARVDFNYVTGIVMRELSYMVNDMIMIDNVIRYPGLLNDDGAVTPENRDKYAKLFESILDNKINYETIVVYDVQGNSILAVENKSGKEIPYVVNNIGNAHDEWNFFDDVLLLKEDCLYISKVEKNKRTNIPVLRVAMPLYNTSGIVIGELLVNYKADTLFDINTNDINMFNNMEILNENGYYLHSQHHREYGFETVTSAGEDYSTYNDYDIAKERIEAFDMQIIDNLIYTSYKLTDDEMQRTVAANSKADIVLDFYESGYYFVNKINLVEIGTFEQLHVNYIICILAGFIVSVVISYLLTRVIQYRNNLTKELETKAKIDHLTGLTNRRAIMDLINLKINEGIGFSLLFLDLDKFKAINDNYGHDMGDMTLIEVSKRFKSSISQKDTVARFGGDEFIILLENVQETTAVSSICERIISNIKKPLQLESITTEIGITIGVRIFENGLNAEEVIDQADQAMYSIKHKKTNSYRFYSDINRNEGRV